MIDLGQSIKTDIELLNNMGFDKTMTNKVYILLRPENIERAIDYMVEINGIYQHEFFSNPDEQNLCYICKQPRQNHINNNISTHLLNENQNHLDISPNYLINDTNYNFNNYYSNTLLNETQNNNNDNNIQNMEENLDANQMVDKISNYTVIRNPMLELMGSDSMNDDEIRMKSCEVCNDAINNNDIIFNSLPCGHLFCTNCWFTYLKTSISESKVENIKCMEHQCNEIISEEFILKHISNDANLLEKYNKFKKRAEIIKDENKKICPKPDCDSYLEKSSISKYVKCENGHEYCFECLNPPHGDKSCKPNQEKLFMKWKKDKKAKRCPKCQMYTEKNEGCNHMTCVYCHYQWCWLCEGEYDYNHYEYGKCRGQQFTSANDLAEIVLHLSRNYRSI